jgi:hypothetical protein
MTKLRNVFRFYNVLQLIIIRHLHDVNDMKAHRGTRVCPSVRIIQLKYCWTDLGENSF